MSSYDLGTAHGKIDLDYEGGRAADEADEDIRKLGDSSDSSDKKVRTFGESLSKFTGLLNKMAKAGATGAIGISSLMHAAQLLAGTLAALAPLVVAALGALPGLLAGGIAAFAVMKVALMGVGDALKASTGDAAAFEEALKKLSPEARAFAVAWRDAAKALKPMQQAIQNAAFDNLAPQVTRVTNGLNSLRGATVKVAKQFNLLGLEAANSLQDRQFEGLEIILDGVSGFLREIQGSIGPVIQGFISLAARASKFSEGLGAGVGSALLRLGNAMQDFDLAAAFEKAMLVLRPLGELLSNIGSIFSSVFGGLQTDAGGALGILAELTGVLADFLKSADGQEALQALGEAMALISGSVGQVFLALLKELAPVIVALLPGLAQLATQVASALVPAIQIAGPILAALAGFLSDNMDVIGPLVIAVYGLVGAYKAYSAIAAGVTAVQTLMKSQLASTLVLWVRNTAALVANTAAAIASTVAAAATRVGLLAWAAAQWVLNTSVYGFPLVWILAAIIAVVAIIVLIATKTTWFQDLWNAAWGGIKDAAAAVADWFTGTIVPSWQKAWSQLQTAVRAVIDFIVAYARFWQGVWKAVFDAIAAYARWWVGNVKAVLEGIKNVLLRIGQFFSDFKTTAIAKMAEIIVAAKNLPGRIISAIGNLGSRMYSKGQELVRGFINGIGSMISAAVNKARQLVNAVTDFLPGSPAKKGPLSGKGWTPYRGKALVEGFAQGMERQIGLVQNLSTKIAVAAVPVVPTALGAATTAGVATLAPPLPPAVRTEVGAGGSITIQSLAVTVQGVLDMSDPQAARQIAFKIHEAIENLKKGYS